jgi:hypothetical protein
MAWIREVLDLSLKRSGMKHLNLIVPLAVNMLPSLAKRREYAGLSSNCTDPPA